MTSSSCSRARSRRAAADGEQLLLAVGAGGLDRRPLLGRPVDRHLELGQDHGHGDADRLSGPALADQPLASLDGPGPRLALGLGRPHQGVGPAVERAGALLAGAQGEPGVHLRLAGAAGRLDQPLALGGVGLLVGGVVGRGEPGLEVGEPGEVLVASLVGGRDRRGDPLGLRAGRARGRAVVAELLGHGGQRRVGLVELGQRHVDPALGVEPLGVEPGDVEAEPLGGGDRLGQLGRGVVVAPPGSPAGWAATAEPPAAKWAPYTSPSRVTAVTSGRSATRARAASRSRDDRGLEEQARQRRPQGVGARHHVDGVRRVAGEPGPGVVVGDSPAEQHPGPAEVTGLEVTDGRHGGVAVGDGHRVGGRAQRRCDRGLVAGVDGQHGRDGAEQARDGVGRGEQRAGAVLAVEPELEGLGAGLEAGAVAVGLRGLLARLGQPLGQVVEHGQRGLVLGVEALLAGVERRRSGSRGR